MKRIKMIIIVKYITIHSCTPKYNQFKTSEGIALCYGSVRIIYFIFFYLMFLLLAWKANILKGDYEPAALTCTPSTNNQGRIHVDEKHFSSC